MCQAARASRSVSWGSGNLFRARAPKRRRSTPASMWCRAVFGTRLALAVGIRRTVCSRSPPQGLKMATCSLKPATSRPRRPPRRRFRWQRWRPLGAPRRSSRPRRRQLRRTAKSRRRRHGGATVGRPPASAARQTARRPRSAATGRRRTRCTPSRAAPPRSTARVYRYRRTTRGLSACALPPPAASWCLEGVQIKDFQPRTRPSTSVSRGCCPAQPAAASASPRARMPAPTSPMPRTTPPAASER